MLELSTDPNSDNPNLVDIERLSRIMIPTDDIFSDLKDMTSMLNEQED